MKKNSKDFNNQFATLFLREDIEENTVTGGGEAYLPGLDVPEKKYKGPKEGEVHDGYKKVKGFRAGHTKDTGGFLYKDLWNVNEQQFKETIATAEKDKVYKLLDLVKDKDYNLYKRFLTWISDIFPHSYDEFRMAAGGLAEAEGDEKFKVGDEVKVIQQGNIYSNKIGEVVDVAPSGNYYVLQFKNGQKASFHESDLEGKDIKKGPKGPQMILSLDEEDSINESYSKFKNETKTRTKAQQMHEAMKLAEKKITDANKILEYISQLKTELFEDEESTKYTHHTKKIMERASNKIAEAYVKLKKLK